MAMAGFHRDGVGAAGVAVGAVVVVLDADADVDAGAVFGFAAKFEKNG